MHVVARASSQEHPLLLADLPPSQGQIRLALSIVVLLIVVFGVTAPFRDIQLARVDPFVPILHAAITINDLITSVLLYSQFVIARGRALLVLASGYLFTALIVIPYTLTFPGVFAQAGLLGAGLQTPSGLYWFWHAGLPLAVIAYVLLKEADDRTSISSRPSPAAISWSVVIVIAMVCGLTLLATTGETFLPRVLLDRTQVNLGIRPLYGGSLLLLCAVALALLWRRRRSVLDLWLMVLCCAWLLELTLGTTFVTARYSVGWYASRFFAFITTSFVLMVLLSETTALYAHLARSVMRQRAADRERQISMDTMAASIAHELNQPLGSITLNAETALLLLAQTPPDTDEARAALTDISASAARGTQVIASLRAMFKESAHAKTLCNANDIVREALVILDIELRAQRISVSTELSVGLPPVLADRGLLQQVFLNLIMNAIEAMRPVADHARRLHLTSEFVQGTSNIRMTVEDSGVGIDTSDEDRIFEPFFTTKSTGTGIGLAICKSIIDTRGGSLRASANNPRGTIFEVVVPVSA
jgi:signal transduction histidine kinase